MTEDQDSMAQNYLLLHYIFQYFPAAYNHHFL